MSRFLLCLLFLLPVTATAELLHLPDNRLASLFHLTETYEHDFPVMAGTVLYQAESNDTYSEGYYLDKHLNFSGKRVTRIFDYDSSLALEFILSRFSASLRQQGYTMRYECLGVDCGEAEAFPAFFGSLMSSNGSRYGYQLLSRNARNDDMVAVYATLIDSRVRVSVDLFGSATDWKYIDLRPAQQVGAFQGLTVPFASSSARLNEYSARLIQDFAENLANEPVNGLLVRGYADRVGDASANKRISALRADRVSRALSEVYEGTICQTQSYGSANPYFHPLHTPTGITDRRVEVAILSGDASC